jgi:predicted nucleic acid-binding Zn ribbon protein
VSRSCARCSAPIPAHKRTDAKWCSSRCGNSARSKSNYQAGHERERRATLKAASYTTKMLYGARHRAATKGLEFSITEADVSIPSHCPVLGIPLDPKSGRRGFHPNSPSLDRIDNGQGYIPGNVCVISSKANTIKRGYTASELRACAEYMERHLGSLRI